jgi:cbb3-type cytochrome oxidase subunit 3
VSQPTPSPKGHSGGAQQTGGSDPTGKPSDGSGDGTTGKQTSNTAVIAGAVVGAVLGTAVIAGVAFFIYRQKKKTQANAANAPVVVADNAKPELDSTSIAPPPAGSPSPSMMKMRMDDVSPVSGISSPSSPYGSELAAQTPFRPPPPMPELRSSTIYSNTTELPGQSIHSSVTHYEAHSQQIHEAPGQYRPPMSGPGQPGMGWQSGPVPNAYEMDGGYAGSQEPHAR